MRLADKAGGGGRGNAASEGIQSYAIDDHMQVELEYH
ncbi:hypothetical protein TIFTF001_044331 [Ficus carica]|uniref:Uncharacterized protein n=1 Tax=Ficus carica TaxID=3494 RepID=A0AA87Z5I2_FICCA|nr:hypothetical protein TIFTF001_044331 [Ficus carica]